MKCFYCGERPRVRKVRGCGACQRAITRNGRCPGCQGPRYGDRREFCPRCGPFKPARERRDGEILFVLVDPRGREREVLRREGEKVPGRRDVKLTRRSRRCRVLKVSHKAWLRARVA